MEERHDGHERSRQPEPVLDALRAGLEGARSFLDRFPAPEPAPSVPGEEIRRRRFPSAKLAALGTAALIEILARREAQRRRPKRQGIGIFKVAVLAVAGLGIAKLVASRR